MLSFRLFRGAAIISLNFFILFLVCDFARTKLSSAKAAKPSKAVGLKLRLSSPMLHHTLAPNMSVPKERYGRIYYPFTTNSLGFRDQKKRMVPLRSSRYRVLFIGDSFTEGVGVPYENTFVGRVEEKLNKKNIEVLNAAVSSYSPIHYYRKIKYLTEDKGLHFNELIVFLDLSDIQDETFYHFDEKENVIGPESPMELSQRYQVGEFGYFLSQNLSLTNRVYRKLRCHLYPKRCLKGALGASRARWTLDKHLYESYGQMGLKRAEKHMSALRDLLQKKSIPLTLAVYPWPDQVSDGDLDSLQVRFWQQWASQRGVKFLNLFPHFFKPNKNTALLRWFLPEDCHWSEAGHKKVAEVVLRFLLNEPLRKA